jgi:hypothetical protein
MRVNDYASDIQLKGNLELRAGSVEIKVIQPNGRIVFKKVVTDNMIIELDKTFAAEIGYWRLKYRSINGEGYINLHLNQ